MANFVLIHGAFHGGWCWSEISSRLKDAGHTVLAPDLPGAGEDQTPLDEVTLGSATNRVIDTLHTLDGQAILVGHSMGGVVITQAAARVPALVSRLVYLTAFRPAHGESLLDLTNLPEGAGDGVQANIMVDGEPPIATFDLTQAATVFYNGVPDDTTQQAIERLDRQPLAVFATPVDIDGVELPPQDYIICTQDRAIMPTLQKLMAERTPAQVYELEAGHSPFYSHPDEVLEILLTNV